MQVLIAATLIAAAIANKADLDSFLTSQQDRPELRCGSEFNTSCPSNMCCSGAGYCGTTAEYCYVPDNCQESFGWCDSKVVPAGRSTNRLARPLQWDNLPLKITQCTKPKTLALTYDDGPSKFTTEVLDVLAKHKARGTFFLGGNINGRGAIDTAWSDVVRRMYTEGHQIGSHTWSHPVLDDTSSERRRIEMLKNERAIANVVGKVPAFMRAPRIICGQACQHDMFELGYQIVD